MGNKIELNWAHKGEHVLRNSATGRWEFSGTGPLPFCPLIELEAYGTEKQKPAADENSNLLIKGDNLLALRVLRRIYEGKVKLIYIDPPFNRGKEDFEAYDDNFTHSVWLSMMYERLEEMKGLLREDGIIFVHIDTHEVHRLMLIMDEIFGANNFMNLISMTTNDPSGFKATGKTLFSTVNFLVVYAKNKPAVSLRRLFIPREFDLQYRWYLLNPEDHYSKWRWDSLFKVVAQKLGYISPQQATKALGKQEFMNRVTEFAIANATRVFRVAEIRGGARKKRLATIEASKQEPNKVFVHPNEDLENFYILNGGQILFYDKRLVEIDGELVPGEILTDVWTDISWNGIANEGGVQLKEGKKPEALLRRIIELSTEPNDLVLDCFGGSGTTGAVAHKLGRRWIMVEIEDTLIQLCLKRLKAVTDGTDQTGISREVDWQGGGGFRYLEVGMPLLVHDPSTQLKIINPRYKNAKLVRAVCQMEGFLLTGDDKYFHGRNGMHLAHVTEDLVDDAYLQHLLSRLPEGFSLTIYALRFASPIHHPRHVALKRLPAALVKSYLSKS